MKLRHVFVGGAVALLALSGVNHAQSATDDLFPPNAKPGECYTRVFVPATYKTVTEEVLVKEASSRIEIVPARYETVTERVLVQEESTRLEVVPATYGWVEEKVQVKPETKKMVEVAAVYGTETERVLVKPAHTAWKTGRGPIERVDNSTGEIMCLVEVPAEYKTVTKRVLKSPARVDERTIPAEYKTVKRKVVTKPASTREVTVPAKYNDVKVRRVLNAESTREVSIPAEYRSVTRRDKITEGHMAWREILCETNTSRDVVRKLQLGLKNAGYDPGSVDGVLGSNTMAAVAKYQASKGMAKGGLTIETLRALGAM